MDQGGNGGQRPSSNTRADTIDDSHMRGPARLKLKIQPPPPEYPYADTFFEMEVFVVDQNDQLKRGEDVPLSLQLLHYESKAPVRDGVLQIDRSSNCRVARSGAGKLRIRVADNSTVERRRFLLRIDPIGRDDIEGATSEKMTVVRSRLEIEESPGKSIPPQWYKDEGGRENCVEIRVVLRDANNRPVRNRQVPLKLVLMYESLQRVHNQEILKLSPDSRLQIDETGSANLRVRIEEVSKNHQRQSFRIKVEPDVQEQPLSVDISSAVSSPILVLSKRIPKRPKEPNAPGHRKNSTAGPNKRSVTPALGGQAAPGSSAYAPGQAPDGISPPAGVEAVDFSALANPGAAIDVNSVTLYDALKSVIQWTGKVVNGLQSVQWTLLGYERKPDGSPNHERPLYNIQNPNPTINAIIRQYATDTMHNLHVLLKRIEAGSYEDGVVGNGVNAGGGGTATAAGGGGGSGWPQDGYGSEQQGPPKRARREAASRGGGGGNGSGDGGGSAGSGDDGDEAPPPPAPPLGMGHSMMMSMGGPPGLQQQASFGMFQPAFMQGSMMLDGLPLNGEGGEMFPEGGGQMDPAEANVHYILAKGYLSRDHGMLGFPAYDYAQYLQGFYKEAPTVGGNGQVIFNPLNRIPGLDDRDVQATREILDAEMKKGSQSVFSLPGCGNSLPRMREDAFTYYWSKSMIFNLEGHESTAGAGGGGGGSGVSGGQAAGVGAPSAI